MSQNKKSKAQKKLPAKKSASAKSKQTLAGGAKAKKGKKAKVQFGCVKPLTMAQILGLVTFFAKVGNKAFAGACY